MVRYLGGSDYHDKRGYSVVTTRVNHITRALGDIRLYAARYPRVPMQRYGRPKIMVSTQDYAQPIMRPLVQTQCAPPQDITDVDEIYGASFPSGSIDLIFWTDVRSKSFPKRSIYQSPAPILPLSTSLTFQRPQANYSSALSLA